MKFVKHTLSGTPSNDSVANIVIAHENGTILNH